jgi:hypothetical protein
MSLSAKQQAKYNTSIFTWVAQNFSNKEFSADELLSAFNNDTDKKVKFPSKKKVSDPNKPKKGNTAWIFFTNDMREKVKADNPDAKTTDLTKIMSPMWKALSPEEKKPYEDKAKADKERYEKEMENYKGSDSDSDSDPEVKPKKSKKVKKAKSDKPKKLTLRAYVMKEHKEQINQLCSDNAVDGKNANFMKMVTTFINGCSDEERDELQAKVDEHNESL